MYSQCPECQTRFRVTAEALRAAHGTVRCGRCGSAFDALARLSDAIPVSPADDRRAPLLEEGTGLGAANGTPAPAEYHFSADDIEKVFIDARDWQRQFGPEGSAEPAVQGSATPAVLVQEDEPIEDITLEGERISIEALPGVEYVVEPLSEAEITGEFPVVPEQGEPFRTGQERGVEPPGADRAAPERASPVPDASADDEPDSEYATPSPREVAAALAAEWEATASRPALREWAAGVVAPSEAEETRPAPSEAAAALATRRWPRDSEETEPDLPLDQTQTRSSARWLNWTVGSVVLAVALAAQVLYRNRQDLARNPQVGPAVNAVYEGLGIGLSPNWDLTAFEIRQWGDVGSAGGSGPMTVRASLTNRAGFAQPHPILRLQFDDRYGSAIAVRDFEPGEYLKNRSEAPRLLDSGATAEAELLIADPGREAVGYRLDVCLRESATLLRCAQGPG